MTDLDWLTKTIDCGDNSCMFKDPKKPSGMRTNGGCLCLSGLDPKSRHFIRRMFQTLMSIRADDSKSVIQRLIQQAFAFSDMATQLATLSRTMLYNVAELERIANESEEDENE